MSLAADYPDRPCLEMSAWLVVTLDVQAIIREAGSPN